MSTADLESLRECLRMVAEVRAKSARVWRQSAAGASVRHGDEAKEKGFLAELKGLLDDVHSQIGDLERCLNSQQPISNPLPLGQSVYLSLDAVVDNVPVYRDLVTSYRWLDKAHDDASGAVGILAQNSLGRSYIKVGKSRRRPPSTLQTASPQILDSIISKLNGTFQNMSLSVTRPNGTKLNALVEVTLGHVLKAVVIFKGLMIEWVVVKGSTEESTRSDGQLDVWTDSKYEVFRRITQNANAAMLNFQNPNFPELSVRTFMTYLHSFISLFTDRCKKCGYHLHNNIPPTWREFKTLEPFHEDCRP